MPNLADLTTGTKLLLGAGFLLLIDLFLGWQKVDFPAPLPDVTVSGWEGIGVLVGLLVIALLVWEGLQLAGMTASWKLPIAANIISAALAGAVAVFAIIEFLTHNEARSWPAWLGLLLAIVLAVGAWLKYSEAPVARATTAPPAAPPPPPAASPPS